MDALALGGWVRFLEGGVTSFLGSWLELGDGHPFLEGRGSLLSCGTGVGVELHGETPATRLPPARNWHGASATERHFARAQRHCMRATVTLCVCRNENSELVCELLFSYLGFCV